MAYTTIDDPSAYFHTQLYSGTGSALSVTNDANAGDFQPDFIWLKSRTSSNNHNVFDSSRGQTKRIYPNLADVEDTVSGFTLNTDGFSTGTSSIGDINISGESHIAWQWKVNGGTRTTFSESGSNAGGGYQVNTTAGISIVDYTGTGSSGATITHGLGATPEFFVVKGRSIGDSWTCYHHKNTSAPETDMLKLDENGATQDNSVFWNDTAPTSSVFTVDGDNGEPKVNQDGETYIAYCFKGIQGYSKFGSYTGNGNADGPFIYLGFKPKYFLLKNTSASQHWYIFDTARSPTNPSNSAMQASGATTQETGYAMDFVSNGFKIRHDDSAWNGSGNVFVYAAFAEHPFVSSEGAPTTAR